MYVYLVVGQDIARYWVRSIMTSQCFPWDEVRSERSLIICCEITSWPTCHLICGRRGLFSMVGPQPVSLTPLWLGSNIMWFLYEAWILCAHVSSDNQSLRKKVSTKQAGVCSAQGQVQSTHAVTFVDWTIELYTKRQHTHTTHSHIHTQHWRWSKRERKEHEENFKKCTHRTCFFFFLPSNLVCHSVIRTIPFSSISIDHQLFLHCDNSLQSFILPHPNSPSLCQEEGGQLGCIFPKKYFASVTWPKQRPSCKIPLQYSTTTFNLCRHLNCFKLLGLRSWFLFMCPLVFNIKNNRLWTVLMKREIHYNLITSAFWCLKSCFSISCPHFPVFAWVFPVLDNLLSGKSSFHSLSVEVVRRFFVNIDLKFYIPA